MTLVDGGGVASHVRWQVTASDEAGNTSTTTVIDGRRITAVAHRRLRPVSSIALLDGGSPCSGKGVLNLALIAVEEEKTQRGKDVPERVGLNDVGKRSSGAQHLALI